MNSRFFEPGPYAQWEEVGTNRFVAWYLKELAGVKSAQARRNQPASRRGACKEN